MSIPARSRLVPLLSLSVLITTTGGCAEVGPFRAGADDAVAPDAGAADAALPTDAAAACTVAANLPTVALGTMLSPTAGEFVRPGTGSQAGATVFTFATALPGSTMDVADVLVVEVVERAAFRTSSAYPFDVDPTASYTAASFILSDFNVQTMASGPEYWASSGSITFTAFGTGSGSAIRGTVSASMYRELDAAQQDVPDGCTTQLMGVTFNLTQQ